MKKSFLILMLIISLIVGIIFWTKNNPEPFNFYDIFQFVILLVIIVFAMILAFRRIGSIKKGLPPEDEFSKKILVKAAARSYYFSLYLWLIIMYLSNESEYDIESLIGAGILGMAVLFAGHWAVLKFNGLKNE